MRTAMDLENLNSNTPELVKIAQARLSAAPTTGAPQADVDHIKAMTEALANLSGTNRDPSGRLNPANPNQVIGPNGEIFFKEHPVKGALALLGRAIQPFGAPGTGYGRAEQTADARARLSAPVNQLAQTYGLQEALAKARQNAALNEANISRLGAETNLAKAQASGADASAQLHRAQAGEVGSPKPVKATLSQVVASGGKLYALMNDASEPIPLGLSQDVVKIDLADMSDSQKKEVDTIVSDSTLAEKALVGAKEELTKVQASYTDERTGLLGGRTVRDVTTDDMLKKANDDVAELKGRLEENRARLAGIFSAARQTPANKGGGLGSEGGNLGAAEAQPTSKQDAIKKGFTGYNTVTKQWVR
jgi:hypothetical protein